MLNRVWPCARHYTNQLVHNSFNLYNYLHRRSYCPLQLTGEKTEAKRDHTMCQVHTWWSGDSPWGTASNTRSQHPAALPHTWRVAASHGSTLLPPPSSLLPLPPQLSNALSAFILLHPLSTCGPAWPCNTYLAACTGFSIQQTTSLKWSFELKVLISKANSSLMSISETSRIGAFRFMKEKKPSFLFLYSLISSLADPW